MSETKLFMNRTRGELIKLAITVLLPFFIFLIPTSEVFTSQLRLFFVITLIAILSFATEALHQTGVSLALPVIYVITQVAPAKAVFAPWTNYIPWMVLGGLILAMVLEKTGLLRRIAYLCINATGASYKGIIWGLTLTGVILNLLMPAQAVIPMAALAYGICQAMNLKPGKASAGITLSAAMASLLPLNWLYNSNLLIVLGLGHAAGGPASIGWLDVFIHNVPMVLYSVIMAFIASVMFKPEVEIQGKEYFKSELEKMGKMGKDEIKSLVITLFLFLFLVTGNGVLHNIEVAWGFALIPCFFFLPGIDLIENRDLTKVNFGFVFFITACLSIGNAAGALGLGKIIAEMALPYLQGQSYYMFFLFVWVLFFLMNFLLTPLAMQAAFTGPLTQIAISLGIEPMTLYYIIMNGCDQIVLPYEYALYLIFFSFGMIKIGDFAKLMSSKVVVNFILVFALLVPYWNFIDLIYV